MKMTTESVDRIEPSATRREIPDSHCPGLYLVVQPSGAKSWAVRYRAGGKPRKLTLGPYPKIPLAESADDRKARLARDPASDPPCARGLARLALQSVATGIDPVADRQLMKAKRAAGIAVDDTVLNVWAEFAEKHIGKMRPGSAAQFKHHAAHFLPLWGERKIQDISKRDCLAVIDQAMTRGGSAANTCRTVLNSFFAWCVQRDIIARSPLHGVKPPAEMVSRERVLADDELRHVWNAAADLGGPFGAIFKVLLLTGARRGEVAGMRYSEIDGSTWTLPAERSKNHRAHSIHLSDAVLRIIESMPRFEGCDFVFTSAGRTPSANFSAAKTKLDKLCPDVADWHTHDLRRSFASGLAKFGVPVHVIERCLNHRGGEISGVAAIYNRHSYAAECKAAWNRWSAHVEGLASGSSAANVVPMVRA